MAGIRFMLNETLKLSSKVGLANIEKVPTRLGYGEGLVDLGAQNDRVVVLTADLAESTNAHLFAKKYPERFIECGVAEQNMMGLAAGLALTNKIPFVSSYAVFSPGRNWDQLRVSVCYSRLNVKVAGAHTGVSVGPDGATHQALEDLAITRVLPNLIVLAPVDYWQTRRATVALGKYFGPAYFRFSRNPTPALTTEKTPFEIGRAQILKDGTDLAIIACGPITYTALEVAVMLERKGVSVMVINNHTIKPLDTETILMAAEKCKKILTLEEHQIAGGMGSAVAEFLSEARPVKLKRVGMTDHFGESGSPEELLKKFGLDAPSVLQYIQKFLKE